MRKYLKYMLLCVIWSTTWAAIKIGVEETPPMVGLALRFTVAALVLLLAVVFSGRKIAFDALSLRLYSQIGLINMALSYYCTYWGTQYIPSGLASILWAALPLFVGLFAHLLLATERQGWQGISAMVLAVVGVVVILSDESLIINTRVLVGSLVVLLGVMVSAYPTVVLKKVQAHYDPLTLTTMSMLIGAVVHLIGATISGEWLRMVWSWRNVASFLYLGVFGSALAFFVYYSLLREIAVVKLSFVTFITPVFATVIGWVWLAEPVTLREVLGALIIFAGLIFYDWKKYAALVRPCFSRVP